jgi:DNA-binding CsgD family transcriptional regulator/catechol 2,3-dioxygenase-like lactoylglutathione lyase family enzyme
MTQPRERGPPPHTDILTPAEWRVAEAVRHGLSNPQTAKRQGVSTDAVKCHIANIVLTLYRRSRRALRRGDGIARHANPHRSAKPMTDPASFGAIGQIARGVKDIAAAQVWYADVRGLTPLFSFGTLAFFDCGGVRLMLSAGDCGAADPIIYFRVGDIHAGAAALAARGAVFINAPHMIHRHDNGAEEWMAVFKDNEGRPLALTSQVI